MKLRIRGNTIRLRLTQSEVKKLIDEGSVEETVVFGPVSKFSYRIESKSCKQITASFNNDIILINIPILQSKEWFESYQASMENGTYGLVPLHILIEKDFQCLKLRSGDEDEDAYPNPLAIDITE